MAGRLNPPSCDTFVVLPSGTVHKGVIFGKNSDRPNGEVQELVYFKGQEYPSGSRLKCTYIEIDQASKTFPVILSKPAWMWGAEMGANDQGVCIGNEAVWSVLDSASDKEERLLGMDFVRLGLERSASAEEALTTITDLLEKYGQGGPCSDLDPDLVYHNSYLIADKKEAWVLETVGKIWAAEKVKSGFRNISNALSIGTNIDRKCANLYDVAKSEGLWTGESALNFKTTFGDGCMLDREKNGCQLLKELSEKRSFSLRDMMSILRNEEAGICMGYNEESKKRELMAKSAGGNQFGIVDMLTILRDKDSKICRGQEHSYCTASSQVSVLSPPGSDKPSCHWFTATPDPSISVFKPFVFTPDVQISHLTVSPVPDPDPAKVIPRFQTKVDRSHTLHKFHRDATNESNPKKNEIIGKLRSMEEECIGEVQSFIDKFEPGQPLSEVDELLKDIVETEIKFYNFAS